METTTPNKWFDLIVEEKPGMKLNRLVCDGDVPPDIVVLPTGLLLLKISRYAASGDQYRYCVATVRHLVNGQLQAPPEPPEAA